MRDSLGACSLGCCDMETIGDSKLWTFLPGQSDSLASTCTKIREAEPFPVSDYLDLARKIAELQFLNREHVLLFRGQQADYKNMKGNTSLKPSLFRTINGRNPGPSDLERRFHTLREG